VLVWGLTGNIACGKSAVEHILGERRIPVIDADMVAREVVTAGSPGLQAVVEAFGAVLSPDGSLDRKTLGRIVFADPDARLRLERITHPRIFQRTAERIAAFAAQGESVAVVSAALMVESGSWRNYAGLAVVTCPPEVQLARLLARDGTTEAEARARVESQLPQSEKTVLASVVLNNSTDLAALRGQVDAWIAADLLDGGAPC
jgi:dephospho-CoA kinase